MSTQPPPSSAADLERLRNLEEFAALGQFLYLFGTDLLGLPDSFSLEVSPTYRARFLRGGIYPAPLC